MRINLNFLPFETSDIKLSVFRRKYNGESRTDGYFVAKLPVDNSKGCDSNYDTYWISLNRFDSAEEYSFCSYENPRLMTSIIWYQFKQQVLAKKPKADVIDKYEKFVSFIVEDLPEGQRVVKVSPYYLGATQQYGFLFDFAFRKKPGIPFDRKIQQLSFSIDYAGKSNANSYLDRMNYLNKFICNEFTQFSSVQIGDSVYRLLNNFVPLDSYELNSRIYIFGNGKEDFDKIRGIKKQPYSLPTKPPLYVFVFKEAEKGSGNELYRALIGKAYPATFSGMNEWFNCNIGTDNVTRINFDFDKNDGAAQDLLSSLQDVIKNNTDKQIIGIFIDSYSHNNYRSDNYIKVKQIFFSLGIPLQVVRNDRIIASDGLKWAISGIGLQIFSKLGGIPWLVKPSTSNCLIFGIGKAHDIQRLDDGTTNIRKYFAYSVCFDSTGLYRSLGVLCDTNNRAQYYVDLEKNIISQIKERITGGEIVSDCVIHTPFRMRNDEMNVIQRSIAKLKCDYANINFTVMRINVKNRFFGFADNNLKVPYESTYIRLSDKEYLVWFEGIKHGREYLNKRVANPTYIEFYYGTDHTKFIQLLQDAVNLAGASWRGFNAKLVPISIFYPQLIAGFIKDFRKIDSNQEVEHNLAQFDTPWFL